MPRTSGEVEYINEFIARVEALKRGVAAKGGQVHFVQYANRCDAAIARAEGFLADDSAFKGDVKKTLAEVEEGLRYVNVTASGTKRPAA